MTGNGFVLEDGTIEAAIANRALGHADTALLEQILGAVAGTPQVRGAPWRLLPQRRSTWAILLAAALLIATLIAIGVGSLRTAPPRLPSPFAVAPSGAAPTVSSPTPIAPPTLAPSPSPTISAAEFCAATTTRVTTGAEMPTTDTVFQPVAHAALDGAVFKTHPDEGQSLTQTDLWSARDGSARRFASLAGPDNNTVMLTDLSPDGEYALFQSFVGDNLGLPFCSDLYLARSDGSPLTKLYAGTDTFPFLSSFSGDGRFVSTLLSTPDSVTTSLGIFDLAGDRTLQTFDCLTGPRPVYGWAPSGARLAILCGDAIEVFVDGASASSLSLQYGSEILISMAWASADSLTLLTAGSDESSTAPLWLRTVGLDGSKPSARLAVSPYLTDGGIRGAVAPDGHSIAFFGTPEGYIDLGWYSIESTTGETTKLVDGHFDYVRQVGWSADGNWFLYIEPTTSPTAIPSLAIVDLQSGSRTSVELPAGCGEAVWVGT